MRLWVCYHSTLKAMEGILSRAEYGVEVAQEGIPNGDQEHADCGVLTTPITSFACEYMKEQSLTESAALVKIVKQFFDGSTGTKVPSAAREKDTALADLRADIALTQAALDGSGAGRGGETTTIQI